MARAWTFAFQLRSKNAAGTVLHTYIPLGLTSAQTPTLVSIDIEHEDVIEERELIDRSRDDIVLGHRRHYQVTLLIFAGAFAGAAGADALEVVLSDRAATVGNYLEISTNGGSSWLKVFVSEDSGPLKYDGKPVGIERSITLSTAALLTTDTPPGSLD